MAASTKTNAFRDLAVPVFGEDNYSFWVLDCLINIVNCSA